MKRILITGSLGQIGSELAVALRARYGADNVVATDIRSQGPESVTGSGPFEKLDTRDGEALSALISRYRIDTVYHLAALLSATAEANPQKAWDINMGGLWTVLEAARAAGCAVFVPSSIAAFGPGTPRDNTPQDTIQRPTSMYGVTKVSGELLLDYYHLRFGLDTRGVRFPGLISNMTPPGGGTTDYAVDIYYEAVRHDSYSCFLSAGTYLDMMYMPDAIKAAIGVMEADPARLVHRNAFNIASMSVCPEDIAAAIRKFQPNFSLRYDVDPVRQAIADSWPHSIDDSVARAEWGWKPDFGLEAMTRDMLTALGKRLGTKAVLS
jgi:nucleoside-diphosphate-sugar epimerase